MSFRSKLFSSITLGAAVAAFAVAGSAQDQPKTTPEGQPKFEKRHRGEGMGKGMREGRYGGHRGMKGGFGLRGIELTDAQKEQIRSIREANKPSEELRAEMKAIHEARKAGTLTDAQKERMKAFRDERMAKMQAMRAQVEAILTPEQKQQLETRRQERELRMQERRELRQQRREQMKQSAPVNKPADQ